MSFSFDASQYDPSVGIEAWPEGWQPAVITGYQYKAANSGNGGYMRLDLKHGQAGTPAFVVLNLWNTNQQAVDISNRELAAITYVTLGATQGRYRFDDPNELTNIPFYVLNKPDAEGRNNFKGYRDANGNDPKKTGGGGGMPTGQPNPAQMQAQPANPMQQPNPMQQAPQQAAQQQQQGQMPGQPAQVQQFQPGPAQAAPVQQQQQQPGPFQGGPAQAQPAQQQWSPGQPQQAAAPQQQGNVPWTPGQ